MGISLNQSSSEILLEAVNRLNQSDVTLDDVEFGKAVGIDMRNREYQIPNTHTKMITKPSGRWSGSVTIKYDRIPLDRLFKKETVRVSRMFTDRDSAIESLNRRYGLNLQPNEIWFYPLDKSGNMTIKILDSVIYEPNTQITILKPDGIDLMLDDIQLVWDFANFELMGLMEPLLGVK